MATCFFFIKDVLESETLSVCLDGEGTIQAPLARRSAEQLRSIQENTQTFIILPATFCTLHLAHLPKLNERKARAAIPYALEETLAQNVQELHFAFDTRFYDNQAYLTVVIDKTLLQTLMNSLAEKQISFTGITLDWFALKAHETWIMERYLLVRDEKHIGALTEDLAARYLNVKPDTTEVYCFPESDKALMLDNTPNHQDALYLVLAQRLVLQKHIDLCQGEFKKDKKQSPYLSWYKACGVLFITWIFILLIGNGLSLYVLNSKLNQVDNNIAQIYKTFFPQATRVISPKFRIKQLLQSSQKGHYETLWTLLGKLGNAMAENKFSIEQFRFQNQTLLVSLTIADFASLENLQKALQGEGVNVRQTQATSDESQVQATLELQL